MLNSTIKKAENILDVLDQLLQVLAPIITIERYFIKYCVHDFMRYASTGFSSY